MLVRDGTLGIELRVTCCAAHGLDDGADSPAESPGYHGCRRPRLRVRPEEYIYLYSTSTVHQVYIAVCVHDLLSQQHERHRQHFESKLTSW
jgi:hypothetical protein